MSTLKERKGKENLFLLNKMYHEFEVAPEEFYLQLKARGLILVCPY